MKSWNRSIRQVQFQNNIFQFIIDFFSPKEANPVRQWAMSNSGNTHRKADFSCAKPRVSNTDRSTCSATSFAWKKEIKHKISFPILPNPSSSRSTPEINKRHWTVTHWCTRLKFVLSQISFSLLEVRKIHEKMENQLEMGKIRHTLKSLFYFFFFNRIQSLVGSQSMNLVLFHWAKHRNSFAFSVCTSISSWQAIQINNYRERTITGRLHLPWIQWKF